MRRILLISAFFFFLSTREVFASESATTTAEQVVAPIFTSWNADADGDGVPDAWEVQIFKTDPQKANTDGDAFTDGQELIEGHDPLKKDAAGKFSDADQDGLDDRLEFLFHADPLKKDTDQDGFEDGKEIALGFSPISTTTTLLEKKVLITLSKQTLEQKLGGVTILTHRVSTGKPGMRTPTGEFKILNKHPRAWSRSAKLWMPYWMAFTNRGHGLHELPEWPGGKKEGANHLGLAVSHGCVRLGIGAAKAVYEWAPIGTVIKIVR